MMIFSCSNQKKITTDYINLDTLVVRATGGLNEYREARPRYWDITHTSATLSFDMKAKEANGHAVLKLHPYCYTTDTLWLDAKSMEVQEVKLINDKTIVSYKVEDDKLKIKFPQSYHASDTLELSIKYKAKPYAESIGGSKAITEDRGLYFINTDQKIKGKPSQIWTQGETESNSHWLPTIDQPNERFTTELHLIVPDSFVTLSNGYCTQQTHLDSGLRMDSWKMNLPIQTYVIMFAIGNFTIVNDGSWKGKEIDYYVEPAYAPYAKLMFQNTPEMIAYFSTITGVDYPWNKYSQIVVRDYVSGAMENTSASLFGEFVNQNAREIADNNFENVVSHELFHQWFGDYANAESWSNLTLNESFANYGEQLWRLHKYGKTSANELAYNDMAKYFSTVAYEDPPLLRYYYNDKEDMFDRVSYEKGGAILKYLHGLIGDKAFYKAMNIYLTKKALQPAEVADWRMAVEEATGLDWNWFFNQWYLRSGHPELKITYAYDDANKQLQVQVQQVQSDSSKYILPMKAKLVYGNETIIEDWKIEKRKQVFTYNYKNGIKPLFIPDATHWLVGIIKEIKNTEEWLQQFNASNDDYVSKRRALASAYMAPTDSVSQEVFHLALKDSMPQIRYYALSLLERLSRKYKWDNNFNNEIKELAIADKENKVRAKAFDVAGAWKIKALQKDMNNAIGDSSYAVAGAALSALQQIDKDSAYRIAKSIINHDIKSDLRTSVWSVISSSGEAPDIAIFESKAEQVYGVQKLSLSNYLYSYSLTVKQDNVFETSMDLLADLASKEQIKNYRYNIGALVFAAKNYYEKQQEDKDKMKMATAKKRFDIAAKYAQQILAEEPEEQNKERYNNYSND